jgi:rhodanese-related sulfurtransferase
MPPLLSRFFGNTSEPVWIDPADLAAGLDEASPPLLVDVRRPDEFTGPLGHIEGALNLPLDQFSDHIADLSGHQRPVILICHTDRRSAAAAAQLRAAGVREVAVLRGGMVAWRQAGWSGK